jgi:hypothetical protein
MTKRLTRRDHGGISGEAAKFEPAAGRGAQRVALVREME